MHDRARDQLGEKCDEQTVVQKTVFPGLSPASIDQVRDLLKGIEGNRKRQYDRRDSQVQLQ